MSGVILYRSKYGSTKQYAEWLRDETGFDLYDIKQCPKDLNHYDVVVLGSSVLAGRVTIAKCVRTQWPALCGKQVYLLLTNITSDPEVLAKVAPQSFPAEITERIKVFPIGGRYSLQRMSFFDRAIIKAVASLEKRPEVKQELLTDRDWMKKDNLQGLLGDLRNR